MAPTPTLGSHPPERGPRPCPGHTSSRRGQWHRQTRHLAAHGPQGDGAPTPPPPTGEAQLWPSSPEGWGRRRCPDRKWGLQWSPGPQKRLLLPASFLGSQGGAAGAAGRSPQSLFSGLSRLAAFGGSRATPSLLPPAVPPRRGLGFCPSPGQGSPSRPVLRRPGHWAPRSSPPPLTCRLLCPPDISWCLQGGLLGGPAPQAQPGSEVGDCRHSKGWPAPGQPWTPSPCTPTPCPTPPPGQNRHLQEAPGPLARSRSCLAGRWRTCSPRTQREEKPPGTCVPMTRRHAAGHLQARWPERRPTPPSVVRPLQPPPEGLLGPRPSWPRCLLGQMLRPAGTSCLCLAVGLCPGHAVPPARSLPSAPTATEHVGVAGLAGSTTNRSLFTKSRTHRILSQEAIRAGVTGPAARPPPSGCFQVSVAQVQGSPRARALRLGGITPSHGGMSGPQKIRLSSKLWDPKMWPSSEEGSLQM